MYPYISITTYTFKKYLRRLFQSLPLLMLVSLLLLLMMMFHRLCGRAFLGARHKIRFCDSDYRYTHSLSIPLYFLYFISFSVPFFFSIYLLNVLYVFVSFYVFVAATAAACVVFFFVKRSALTPFFFIHPYQKCPHFMSMKIDSKCVFK